MDFEFAGETMTFVMAPGTDGAMHLAVSDATGLPYAKLSVNTPLSPALPTGVFYIKHYSENAPLFAHLTATGVLRPADGYPVLRTGFVDLRAYRLHL